MGLRIPVYALIIKASLYSEWRNTGSVRLLGQSGLLEEVRLGAHGEGRRVRRRLLEHFPSLLTRPTSCQGSLARVAIGRLGRRRRRGVVPLRYCGE